MRQVSHPYFGATIIRTIQLPFEEAEGARLAQKFLDNYYKKLISQCDFKGQLAFKFFHEREGNSMKEVLDVLQNQYNKGAWDKETEIEPKVIGS